VSFNNFLSQNPKINPKIQVESIIVKTVQAQSCTDWGPTASIVCESINWIYKSVVGEKRRAVCPIDLDNQEVIANFQGSPL
jgi:hypothetical protein